MNIRILPKMPGREPEPGIDSEGTCPPDPDQSFVSGSVLTSAGVVPRVSGALSVADRLGAVKVRLGLNRMNYSLDPGLYALGQPDENSPVLVTASYKSSFDKLRAACQDRDAWILVLDTRGVNVWCAAGKGTFGTEELVARLRSSGLENIVGHRRLILPQLGAPGVAAHEVKRLSGFAVVYGPVQASDLPAFMDAGLKAAAGMREKRFPLAERAALIPMEFIPALKYAAVLLPLFFILGGLGYQGGFRESALTHGLWAVIMIGAGILAGTVLTPLLLPWLPGRSFAVKGGQAGIIGAVMVAPLMLSGRSHALYYAEFISLTFIAVALAAFLGTNFTGASTYTSLSGVRQEMKQAVPLEIAAGLLGLISWAGFRFLF